MPSIAVKAKVFTINGFSAHAGQSQILDWLSHFQTPSMQVFLVHGEYSAQQKLASLIRQRFGINACIPDYLEEITLKSGEEPHRAEFPEKAAPRIDWGSLFAEMETKLAHLRGLKTQLESKNWVEQVELRDRLAELDHNLSAIISSS